MASSPAHAVEVDDSELVEEFDPADVVEVGMGGGMNPLPQERPARPGGGAFAGQGPSAAIGNVAESSIVSQLIQQHREDKKRLFELLEIFQRRILTLEDQVKQLEAPKAKRRWWAVWR